VCKPALIFLDEPTSGLDSAAAFNICQCLKDLAVRNNKTVIATIHQPSTDVCFVRMEGKTWEQLVLPSACQGGNLVAK
jgi:ABC-type cobalamin/Fe3+-siderophores transport system ATPase subunit